MVQLLVNMNMTLYKIIRNKLCLWFFFFFFRKYFQLDISCAPMMAILRRTEGAWLTALVLMVALVETRAGAPQRQLLTGNTWTLTSANGSEAANTAKMITLLNLSKNKNNFVLYIKSLTSLVLEVLIYGLWRHTANRRFLSYIFILCPCKLTLEFIPTKHPETIRYFLNKQAVLISN